MKQFEGKKERERTRSWLEWENGRNNLFYSNDWFNIE